MKPLRVGGNAVIIDGILKGHKGKIVGFDSELDEAWVELDSLTLVGTNSENLLQDGESVQLSLNLNVKDDLNDDLDTEDEIGW